MLLVHTTIIGIVRALLHRVCMRVAGDSTLIEDELFMGLWFYSGC
jgi:hypothetical protein